MQFFDCIILYFYELFDRDWVYVRVKDFISFDKIIIGLFILNNVIFKIARQCLLLYFYHHQCVWCHVEMGEVFPPSCLSWRLYGLSLEVFKTFVVSDQSKLPSEKFILPFHESFQDCNGLVFMHVIVMLCMREFL